MAQLLLSPRTSNRSNQVGRTQIPVVHEESPTLQKNKKDDTYQQETIPTLLANLYQRVPFLRNIQFHINQITESQAHASFYLLIPSAPHPESQIASTRDTFTMIADHFAALTLAPWFPQTDMFRQDEGHLAGSLFYLKSPHLLDHNQSPPHHIMSRCLLDAECLLDYQTIFKDRGQCDIPTIVQFFHEDSLLATTSPTITLHRDAPLLYPKINK